MSRGHVQIYRCAGRSEFEVFDWSEHYDSGASVGTFATRGEAEIFARAWADEYGRAFHHAEIIPFNGAAR